jgi:hypothetical protein
MAFPARPQPAAPTHASAHRIRRKSPLQSCRAIRRSLVHTNLYEQASPQADRGSRCNPASASPNPWRNPHSARGTAATHFPRFRALALFGRRPPERVVRPSSRRPKTCTQHTSGSRRRPQNHLADYTAAPRLSKFGAIFELFQLSPGGSASKWRSADRRCVQRHASCQRSPNVRLRMLI